MTRKVREEYEEDITSCSVRESARTPSSQSRMAARAVSWWRICGQQVVGWGGNTEAPMHVGETTT